jgi:hypothetical protein
MCLPIGPTFVLPYKRYASVSILPLARQYVDNDRLSYRQVVKHAAMPIGYSTPQGAPKIDERALNHSTIWRWLAWLGLQSVALQVGLNLWTQHDGTSTLHRFVGAVDPHKYRSEPRGELLRIARRLLHLIDRWDRTFAEKFFPRFATRGRPP